jgi:predicted transcriptional regulator
VEKSLKELSERGLVRKEKEDYTITNDGLKILAQISRERR